MSYHDLINVVGLYKEEDVKRKFSNYYKKVRINGLNYFEYRATTNTTAIITPNHVVHHEATCYLLDLKYSSTSINTVLSAGQDIKKFLDYLLIWGINLADVQVDIRIVMIGFINHLRVLDKWIPDKAVNWSFLTEVPMHEYARSAGKISSIGYNKDHFMEEKRFEAYSIESIRISTSTALSYLVFLKERTDRYKDIDLTSIPVKNEWTARTMISGTLGSRMVKYFDVNTLLEWTHINTEGFDNDIKPLEEEVFTLGEIDHFMSVIEDTDYQNKLLFTMLKCFGLRRAELAKLMIQTSSLPKKFYDYDFNDATEYLKENLKGDIEFSEYGWWVCKMINRESDNPDKQNKTKNRKVRLLRSFMPSDDFSGLLSLYLQERQFLIEQSGIKDHNYLFISKSNRSKNQPISGDTVYTRYSSIAKKSPIKDRLLLFSPHSFRHFFATYLIREKKIDINDVSSLLGHTDPITTRKIYLHYLPEKEPENKEKTSQARKMAKTFKGEEY